MPEDVLTSPPRRPPGPVRKVLTVLLGGAVAVALGFVVLRGGADSGPPPVPPASRTASPTGPATPTAGPGHTLRGAPPAGRTGLRLLVAADPPVVIDVDSGTRRPVRGLPTDGRRVHSVVAFGANAAIIVSHKVCDDCGRDADLFVVGRDEPAARRIGRGDSPVPARDGRSVWVMHSGDRGRCRLDRLTVIGGEPSRRDIATLDCRIRLVRDAEPGLVLDGPADGTDDAMLLDADGTSRAELRGPAAYAGGAWVQFDTFGRRVLLRGGMIEWTWPSALEPPAELVPDYGDRFVFAEFAAPQPFPVTGAEPSPLVDLWVLDTVRPRWIRTPRMPLAVSLKDTAAAWTPDNRLVMAGTFAGAGEAVAIWKLGRHDWSVHPVDLPENRSSDSFAILNPLA